jgi:hypothetical protein
LRGGKHSIWEGGVKATAFISGTNALGRQRPQKRVGLQPAGFDGLMHGADWMATLASVAGYDTSTIPLPIDGVDLWNDIVGAARGKKKKKKEEEEEEDEDEDEEEVGALNRTTSTTGRRHHYNRTTLVVGNSTNECSWAVGDARYHAADGVKEAFARGGDVPAPPSGLGCGFGIRMDEAGHRWKLIKGYGGGPNTWCNSTSQGAVCGIPQEGQGGGRGGDGRKQQQQQQQQAPPPPAPEGGSCPKGYCLYDVLADPFELHEVSQVPANADIVARLIRQIDKVLLTYTQYEEDPQCQGKTTFAQDPVVGKTWQPWC